MASALLETLEPLTSASQQCYFAARAGYVPFDSAVLRHALPVGQRDYVVLTGPIGAGRELGEWFPSQTPNFACPEDRHWL